MAKQITNERNEKNKKRIINIAVKWYTFEVKHWYTFQLKSTSAMGVIRVPARVLRSVATFPR